jgi:hypothetical protein
MLSGVFCKVNFLYRRPEVFPAGLRRFLASLGAKAQSLHGNLQPGKITNRLPVVFETNLQCPTVSLPLTCPETGGCYSKQDNKG